MRQAVSLALFYGTFLLVPVLTVGDEPNLEPIPVPQPESSTAAASQEPTPAIRPDRQGEAGQQSPVPENSVPENSVPEHDSSYVEPAAYESTPIVEPFTVESAPQPIELHQIESDPPIVLQETFGSHEPIVEEVAPAPVSAVVPMVSEHGTMNGPVIKGRIVNGPTVNNSVIGRPTHHSPVPGHQIHGPAQRAHLRQPSFPSPNMQAPAYGVDREQRTARPYGVRQPQVVRSASGQTMSSNRPQCVCPPQPTRGPTSQQYTNRPVPTQPIPARSASAQNRMPANVYHFGGQGPYTVRQSTQVRPGPSGRPTQVTTYEVTRYRPVTYQMYVPQERGPQSPGVPPRVGQPIVIPAGYQLQIEAPPEPRRGFLGRVR